MSVFAGQGDAARSLGLLWGTQVGEGPRTSPGPKPALSVDAIVRAAIAVADADTMSGLSMRTVAERLGYSSMALYTYVAGKAELVDLMYDRVHAELSTHHGPDRDWRAAITSWAEELRSFCLRHPWVLQVSYARPVLGPHEQAVLERLLTVLYEAGLPPGTLRSVVGALFHFVRGTAQTVAESRLAAAATGMSDQEWWADRSAVLAKVAPDFAERFPMSARLASEAVRRGDDDRAPYLEREADEIFAAGLAVLLDGIEAARRNAPAH